MSLTSLLYIPLDDHFLAEIYESSLYAQNKFSAACMCALYGPLLCVCVYVCIYIYTHIYIYIYD
jgi:hypothetical protein